MKKFFMAAFAITAANMYAMLPIDTLHTYQLQDVQVVSTRATKKTPIAYSNINQKQIKTINKGKDIPFLLSTLPSVTITSDAGNGIGYTSLRVRGVDPSRINITVNGIPQNDAESATLFWVNMNDFASSVQSMQLQRGAGTSTNGAGAFGATLNMQTENIGNKPFFAVDLAGGSYNSHKETLRFGTGLLGGHWGIQGRLSNIGSDGYLDRASTKLNSYFLQAGYFSDNTMVKFVTFNGIERTYHAWNYASKYEQSLYGRTYNSCGEYYDAEGNRKYYDGQTDNYHQQNYQLHLTQILNPQLNFNVALHYTKGFGYYEQYKKKQEWYQYHLTNDKKLLGDLIRQKKLDNNFYGAVASVNFNNQQGLTANIGGGWNKYDGGHLGNVIWTGAPLYIEKDKNGKKKNIYQPTPKMLQPNTEYYHNDAIKKDANVYAKVNWEFIQGVNAYADLQYRNVSIKMNGLSDAWSDDGKQIIYNINECFNFFNPKFGITYQVNNQNRIYASYAIAHKEPTRNTLEQNISTKLEAEKLGDLELGYHFNNKNVSAGINLYYMNYSNEFVLTGELDAIGEMKTKNAGRSYRMGIELETAWKPVDWFTWNANATLSKNRVKNWMVKLKDKKTVNLGDAPTSFSPSIIFNNMLAFNYKGFSANIHTQYIGEQYLTNTGFRSYQAKDDKDNDVNVSMMLNDIFTTNLNIAYTFACHKLGLKKATIGGTVYNLFSATYDNNGWASPGFEQNKNGDIIATDGGKGLYMAGFAPQAPINFLANLSLTF